MTADAGAARCCKCGAVIATLNDAYLCSPCLSASVDITQGIVCDAEICQCPKCRRFENNRKIWLDADWESKELLTICLKLVRGLKRTKLVDAGFVYAFDILFELWACVCVPYPHALGKRHGCGQNPICTTSWLIC